MARKKKTKLPVKALGTGAAALLAVGLFAGGEEEAAPEPTATPYLIHRLDPQTEVYVSKKGVIHFDKTCSGMKNYTAMTLEKADAAGYEYCSRCAW